METAKEVVKTNGKAKVKKAAPKPNGKQKPVEKAKAPQKESVWSLTRNLLAQGKKDEEIKKAAYDFLLKTLDAKQALEQWSARLAYRALFRAKKAAKAGKGK